MSTEKQDGLFNDLVKLLAGVIITKLPELAQDAIEAIFHKHKDEIVKAADPISILKAASEPDDNGTYHPPVGPGH